MQLFSNDSLLMAAATLYASGDFSELKYVIEGVLTHQGYEKFEYFCELNNIHPDSPLDQHIYDGLMEADETDGVWAKVVDMQTLMAEGLTMGLSAS